MKLTLAFTAAVTLLADPTLGFHLPAFLEPRQQQQQAPKCSLYSGFKNSPSFTSFCKQLSRATKVATSVVQSSTSPKKTPSISTERLMFDGGRTSTVSPVHPVISSAEAGNTYEMQNYTITTSPIPSKAQVTTSSKPVPSDVEVNCYINGSKVPLSECTRTAGLTRTHGYTYSYKTSSLSRASSSKAAATSSAKVASSSSAPAASSKATRTSSVKLASSSSTLATSSKKATTSSANLGSLSSAIASSKSILFSSKTGSTAPIPSSSILASGQLTSTNCTRTQNLTRLHGYTYSQGTAPAASTATLSSSVPSSSSAKTTASAAVTAGLDSTSKVAFGTGSTFTTSFVNSYDCNNITAVEPHRADGSIAVPATTSSVLSSSGISNTRSVAGVTSSTASASSSDTSKAESAVAATSSTASTGSSDISKTQTSVGVTPSTGAVSSPPAQSVSSSAKAQTTSSAAKPTFKPVGHAEKFEQTSTTTVVDATVTTIVPCATDIGEPSEQKRDISFMPATAGGLCDAGVYCVNSTYVSDAPPSWHWDAVSLKQGQTCLEDNVFNTEWVELQCACAGL